MNNMLSASVLDSWARENPRKAQELLPELVLRLILRTSSQIADYDFPIEKGIFFLYKEKNCEGTQRYR